jgi:hypothetical protein
VWWLRYEKVAPRLASSCLIRRLCLLSRKPFSRSCNTAMYLVRTSDAYASSLTFFYQPAWWTRHQDLSSAHKVMAVTRQRAQGGRRSRCLKLLLSRVTHLHMCKSGSSQQASSGWRKKRRRSRSRSRVSTNNEGQARLERFLEGAETVGSKQCRKEVVMLPVNA